MAAQATAISPRTIRLALCGLGNVATELVRLVGEHGAELAEREGVELVIAAVARRSGSVSDRRGLDPAELLAQSEAGRAPAGAAVPPGVFCATAPADVVVETLPLEPMHGRTATRAITAALRAGRHVVSANKGPVAHSYATLRAMAAEHGVHYRFEAAVGDGMPVFNLARETLPGVTFTRFHGVLNSTSNVVLDQLAEGGSIEHAVAQAQAAGIAEENPAFDLDGWDGAVKGAALSAVLGGAIVDVKRVARTALSEIDPDWPAQARRRGGRVVATVRVDLGGASPAVRVGPEEVAPEHPFHGLRTGTVALELRSNLLSPLLVQCETPTPRDTAYGLLADILTIA